MKIVNFALYFFLISLVLHQTALGVPRKCRPVIDKLRDAEDKIEVSEKEIDKYVASKTKEKRIKDLAKGMIEGSIKEINSKYGGDISKYLERAPGVSLPEVGHQRARAIANSFLQKLEKASPGKPGMPTSLKEVTEEHIDDFIAGKNVPERVAELAKSRIEEAIKEIDEKFGGDISKFFSKPPGFGLPELSHQAADQLRFEFLLALQQNIKKSEGPSKPKAPTQKAITAFVNSETKDARIRDLAKGMIKTALQEIKSKYGGDIEAYLDQPPGVSLPEMGHQKAEGITYRFLRSLLGE